MAYALTNHMPAQLSPEHLIPIAGDYDPLPAIRKSLVDPMYQGLAPGTQATLLDAAGQAVNPDDLVSAFVRVMGDVSDPAAEGDVKNLLSQATIDYTGTTHLLANEFFVVQAQESLKLPHPSPTIRYFAQSDVIPAAKRLLAKGDDGSLLVSLAYAYSPETLGYWFLTEQAFEDFKTWMQAQLAPFAGGLPGDTSASLAKFYQEKLSGLTQSLILRSHDADKVEEYSFARILVHMLSQYSIQERQRHGAALLAQSVPGTQPQAAQQAGMLPFVMSELYLPRTVVLANVELHAHSSAKKVDSEWNLIKQSLTMKPTIIPNGAISKLTALPRALAKARSQAANAMTNRNAPAGRSAAIKFRKRPPAKVDIVKDLMRVLRRMGKVNMSQNAVRNVKSSFARANRRHPDDPNLQGKTVSTQYMPDIHIFLDCSGSVSEENYQDTVIMLIAVAKKLDVNLYFSSFSHVLSQPMLLRTKGKSVTQIWHEFRKIPKVSGGTQFEQIWHFVNESNRRKRRLNLVITDFEWTMRNQRVDHPKNVYYAPLAGMSWTYMVESAKRFSKSMKHIDPAIAAKFLGMTL